MSKHQCRKPGNLEAKLLWRRKRRSNLWPSGESSGWHQLFRKQLGSGGNQACGESETSEEKKK